MNLNYTYIFADDDGTTHFKDLETPLQLADYAPPAPPINISKHQSASGIVAVGFPPGWYGDFHPAPKRQWMIVVTGCVEVGVSDGETRIFPTGAVTLLEETGSKGHTTRVIGDQAATLMVIEID